MRSFSASTASTLIEINRTMLFHVSSKLFVLSSTLTVLVRNLVSTFVESKAFGCYARKTTYFKQSTSNHVRALQLRMVVLLSLAYVVRFSLRLSWFSGPRKSRSSRWRASLFLLPETMRRLLFLPPRSIRSTSLLALANVSRSFVHSRCLPKSSPGSPREHCSTTQIHTNRGDPKTSPTGTCQSGPGRWMQTMET